MSAKVQGAVRAIPGQLVINALEHYYAFTRAKQADEGRYQRAADHCRR